MGVFSTAKGRLIMTASLIGMAGSVTSIALLRYSQHKVLKATYCTEALRLLENNTRAIELIGAPVRIHRPELTDRKQCLVDRQLVNITVPFTGAHKSGTMRIEADRWSVQHDWSVRLLEVKLTNMPNKLLIVYRRNEEDHQPPPQTPSSSTIELENSDKPKLVW